ncbi:uncharacterized protein DUF1510 [Planomicrobium soli]|uniref:Uncharacterized protein DUF1510 n=1 Tax=Planomicrobium soli TaxID=1176648 RepID=A0A2P8H4W1_9BACL|nr:DUF1510 family protein [Planomicrobium soli]PSL41243.1 uncharacterized protein DUF1510 [Planomicrobium soli]
MSNKEPHRYPSRVKKKKNRSNTILNGMIGLVFMLILITGAFIFLGNDKEKTKEPETVQISTETEEQTSEADNNTEGTNGAEKTNGTDEADNASENSGSEENTDVADEKEMDEENATEEKEQKEGTVIGGTITHKASNDPIVEETVINTSWEPVKTSQKGEHVSVYEKNSVDWKEKVNAISYATGLKEDNMYIMRLQNGGSPQKSIGVVQSKDQKEKYRVHLEWVDGKGWKPVKMDILKTLEGAY